MVFPPPLNVLSASWMHRVMSKAEMTEAPFSGHFRWSLNICRPTCSVTNLFVDFQCHHRCWEDHWRLELKPCCPELRPCCVLHRCDPTLLVHDIPCTTEPWHFLQLSFHCLLDASSFLFVTCPWQQSCDSLKVVHRLPRLQPTTRAPATRHRPRTGPQQRWQLCSGL